MTRFSNIIQGSHSLKLLILCLYILANETVSGASNLRVSSNGHYIETKAGKPFFYLGDTEWLLNRHSDAQVIKILKDRAAKGFTVIQVFSSRNWKEDSTRTDYQGNYPFIDKDVTRLNTAYWNRWRWIADECAKNKLFFALHLGGPGRKEEPYSCKDINQCYEYGRKIGETFKDKSNIIFNIGEDMHGSEGVGPDDWRAIAEGVADGVNGINSFDKSADYETTFMTFHPSGGTPFTSSTWFHKDPWLDANGIEVWHKTGTVYPVVNADYNKSNPVKPVLMVEGWYEKENDCTPEMVRNEAWHAFFAGGFYGYGHYENWAQYKSIDYLNSQGAKQMGVLSRFFKDRKWWNFIPDQEMIISGQGVDSTLKAAVRSQSGDECYVYYPVNSPVKIALNRITKRSEVSVKWFNPQNGTTKPVGHYKTSQTLEFIPPKGWDDAVLCISI